MNATNTEQKLKAAEAKHAAATTAHKDAQAQLEQALAALKTEGTDKARKAVLAAEDATRLTSTELGWAIESLEHARAEHEQAEHAQRVAAYEQACQACSVDVFRVHVAPIVKRLAELDAERAELQAQAQTVSNDFTSRRTALASAARKVGTTAGLDWLAADASPAAVLPAGVTPALIPPYAKVFEAELRIASGVQLGEVLREVFDVNVISEDVQAQLALAYGGNNPKAVSLLFAQLTDAEGRRGVTVRKLLGEGSGIGSGASPIPFDDFEALTDECNRTRTALRDLGFEGVADKVAADVLAHELEQAADTRHIALVLDRHRAAKYRCEHEVQQGHDSKARVYFDECRSIKGELLKLGCPRLVGALPTPNLTRQSPGLAFVAF